MAKNLTKREQNLLLKMYEVQDELEVLLDKGKDDEDYQAYTKLVTRLEKHLADKAPLT